jgi:hypothetical protein
VQKNNLQEESKRHWCVSTIYDNGLSAPGLPSSILRVLILYRTLAISLWAVWLYRQCSGMVQVH